MMHPGLTTVHIRNYVEGFYRLPSGALSTRSRKRKIARSRQVAMYLTRIMTRKSFPDIGERFGGYDHSTVIHAVRNVQRLIETDPDFALDVEVLRQRVVGQ